MINHKEEMMNPFDMTTVRTRQFQSVEDYYDALEQEVYRGSLFVTPDTPADEIKSMILDAVDSAGLTRPEGLHLNAEDWAEAIAAGEMRLLVFDDYVMVNTPHATAKIPPQEFALEDHDDYDLVVAEVMVGPAQVCVWVTLDHKYTIQVYPDGPGGQYIRYRGTLDDQRFGTLLDWVQEGR